MKFRVFEILCGAILAAAAVGCVPSSDDGGASGDGGGSGVLTLDAPGMGLHIEDRGAMAWRNAKGWPLGIAGTLDNGERYILRRDGDLSDGHFEQGTYDAAGYPYHFSFIRAPEARLDGGWGELPDGDCRPVGEGCMAVNGLGGTWTITSTSPFAGTFQIDTLTSEDYCWTDEGGVNASGCDLRPGVLTGSFNVEETIDVE